MGTVDRDSLSTSSGKEDTTEAASLLEECWFFENLFDRRARRMSRSFSDPSPSSRKVAEEMAEPPLVRRSLLRAPSLPPFVCRDEIEDEDNFPRMGTLIRQASLKLPEPLPSRSSSKGVAQNHGVSRQASRRIQRTRSLNMEAGSARERRRPCEEEAAGKAEKSATDLESEEVQGFEDLGFRFEKDDLTPRVVNILPGLQKKNGIEQDDGKVRRPYLSEAWRARNSPPVIPSCVGKKSDEHMKAQIKCWARTVASNVR